MQKLSNSQNLIVCNYFSHLVISSPKNLSVKTFLYLSLRQFVTLHPSTQGISEKKKKYRCESLWWHRIFANCSFLLCFFTALQNFFPNSRNSISKLFVEASLFTAQSFRRGLILYRIRCCKSLVLYRPDTMQKHRSLPPAHAQWQLPAVKNDAFAAGLLR